MCRYRAQLEALGASVVLISFGTQSLAAKWIKETRVPFDLWLDPDRAAYRAYGLERSLRRAWAPRVWWAYARLMASGRAWRGIQGDSGQMGGDFIVGPDGRIRLAHRSTDPTDRPSVQDLLQLLAGRTDPGQVG